jgi:hypothetical protein
MAVNTIEYPSIGEHEARAMMPARGRRRRVTRGGSPPRTAPTRSPAPGDPVAIIACLGDSDAFDKSITDFSHRYADRNEQDYQEFVKAIHSGRLEAREGV